MTAFGIMLGFAGIIVLIAALAQAAQNRSYAACTEAATGTVTHKRSRKVKNGTSRELTVSYSVNGVAYENVFGALPAEYTAISLGDQLDLLYKPANPKKAARPEQLRPKNVRMIALVGTGLLVAGVALFLLGSLGGIRGA